MWDVSFLNRNRSCVPFSGSAKSGLPGKSLSISEMEAESLLAEVVVAIVFVPQANHFWSSHAELQTASWLGKVNMNALNSSFICQAPVIL